jgi:hypothetical protein
MVPKAMVKPTYLVRMKTLVPALWGLVLAGLVMKFMHWPLASIVLILSCSSIVVVYYLPKGGAIVTPEIISTRLEVFGLGMARYAVAATVLGFLFSMQYWPNGVLFLVVGGTTSVVAFVALWRAAQLHPQLTGVHRSTMGLMAGVVLGAVLVHLYIGMVPAPIDVP